MSNFPPFFSSFGKLYSDLSTKNYDTDRQVKIKSTTQSGVTFETSVKTASKTSDYSGFLKTIIARAGFGTIETEFGTDYSGKFRVENDQWKKGVVGTLRGEQSLTNPHLSAELSYRREYAAVSAEYLYKGQSSYINLSDSLGYEGLSVGGSLGFKVDTSKVESYDIGAEYSKPNQTFAVKTLNSIKSVTASYIHNLNPDTTIGGNVDYGIDTQAWKAGAGVSLNCDRDTTVKFKVSTDRKAAFALEQRLGIPRMKLGFSSEYSFDKAPVPERFGLSLGFGEF